MDTDLCKKCGNPREVYYGPWCPRCNKPEVQSVQELNLVQAVKHLEAIGNKGLEQRVLQKVFGMGQAHNETSFIVTAPDKVDAEADPQWAADFNLIKETWSLGDNIQFYLSL